MQHRFSALFAILSVCSFFSVCAASPPSPLVVGWHDEFSRPMGWTPVVGGGADVSLHRSGVMTLTLGPSAAFDPRTFSWAGVSRDINVNLDEYPILAVRALRVSHGCWWDANVQALNNGHPMGTEYKSDSLPERGLLLFDVGAYFKRTGFPDGFGPRPAFSFSDVSTSPRAAFIGRQHLRLRLNVAGLKRGGSVDYAWVRFIHREDAERLRSQPDLQNVLLAP